MTESVPRPIDFQSATISTGSIGLSDLLGSGVDADPFSDIEQSVRSTTGGNDPAALRDAAVATVRAAVTGDQQKAQEACERPDDASGLVYRQRARVMVWIASDGRTESTGTMIAIVA